MIYNIIGRALARHLSCSVRPCIIHSIFLGQLPPMAQRLKNPYSYSDSEDDEPLSFRSSHGKSSKGHSRKSYKPKKASTSEIEKKDFFEDVSDYVPPRKAASKASVQIKDDYFMDIVWNEQL